MIDSSTEKVVGINLKVPGSVYKKLKILSAIRGSGGARNEALEAVVSWVNAHRDQLPKESAVTSKDPADGETSRPLPSPSRARSAQRQ